MVSYGEDTVKDKGKQEAVKHHIAVLIRQGKRDVGYWPEYPAVWRPAEVIDPRTEKPFTYPGSWDFIAERLEEPGSKLETMTLNKPPGKTGYVFKERTKNGRIYVKLQLLPGKGDFVIGRSFHYDKYEEKQDEQ